MNSLILDWDMSNPINLSSISLPGESWAEIYEGRYAVSSLGRVISLSFKGVPRQKIMTQRDIASYLRVHLHINGKGKQVLVHRLVAMAFIPNPSNLPEVNHKNGNKHDNRVDNLEWVTKSQNKIHSIEVLKRPHPNLGKSLELSLRHKTVCQYSKRGDLIKTYHSIRVASMMTGINETNISRCANGKRDSAGGYVWRLKSE